MLQYKMNIFKIENSIPCVMSYLMTHSSTRFLSWIKRISYLGTAWLVILFQFPLSFLIGILYIIIKNDTLPGVDREFVSLLYRPAGVYNLDWITERRTFDPGELGQSSCCSWFTSRVSKPKTNRKRFNMHRWWPNSDGVIIAFQLYILIIAELFH